jgi:hypothetical protein
MSQTSLRSTHQALWPAMDMRKAAAERRTAVHALGLIHALRHHQLTVDQAWDELFSFATYMELKKRRFDPRLLKLLEWAMELPHVEPLGEAALAQSYDSIERLAESVLSAKDRTVRSSHKSRGTRSVR